MKWYTVGQLVSLIYDKNTTDSETENDLFSGLSGAFQVKLNVQTENHGILCFVLNLSDSMWEVREKIKEQTGEDSLDHYLIYNNTFLDDAQRVPQSPLRDGCCVKWRKVLVVWVVTEGDNEIPLWLWRDATVKDAKELLAKKKTVSFKHHMLMHEGVELSNEWTMEECGIAHTGDKLQLLPKKSSRQAKLEHRVIELEKTLRQLLQEVGQIFRGLSANEQHLDKRVEELEQKTASLQKKESSEAQLKKRGETIEKTFTKNFESFLDTDLDVADRLYAEQVLNKDKYCNIFDKNSQLTRKERVRGMLMEVMRSEKNITIFRQALLDHGDTRSRELAKLLD